MSCQTAEFQQNYKTRQNDSIQARATSDTKATRIILRTLVIFPTEVVADPRHLLFQD